MDDRLGEAQKLGEHEFVIRVDRRENTSIADVRRTLEHEVCHVYVDWQEPEEHGPAFLQCMGRFSRHEKSSVVKSAKVEKAVGKSPHLEDLNTHLVHRRSATNNMIRIRFLTRRAAPKNHPYFKCFTLCIDFRRVKPA